MGRWEPDARGRLEKAALDLYNERGYEQTTVVDIATRAGLTERTFFRHFADKREVLFSGAAVFQELFISNIVGAPDSVTPQQAMAAALLAVAERFEPGRAHSRERQNVIEANPVLQERELIKLASLATAIAAALRERGVPELAASLTAEAGVAVFRVAFERWISEDNDRSFPDLISHSLDELRTVFGP